MKKVERRGLNPVVAVLFLLVSGGIAANQLLGGGLSVGGLGLVATGPADEELALDGEQAQSSGALRWTDLLAVHGSYGRDAPVRMAFAVLENPAARPATPIGETRAGSDGRWVGEDPPSLRLGVVMVSAGSRRAVVDGHVVGVGDELAGGKVAAIERGRLVLAWGGRTLTYDLDAPQPLEFREELARRGGVAATEVKEGNQEETK